MSWVAFSFVTAAKTTATTFPRALLRYSASRTRQTRCRSLPKGCVYSWLRVHGVLDLPEHRVALRPNFDLSPIYRTPAAASMAQGNCCEFHSEGWTHLRQPLKILVLGLSN